MEEAETKRSAATGDRPEPIFNAEQVLARHQAVASFWKSFVNPAAVESGTDANPEPDITDSSDDSAVAEDASVSANGAACLVDAEAYQANAMRDALAAARAEVEAAKNDTGPTLKKPRRPSRSGSKNGGKDRPIKVDANRLKEQAELEAKRVAEASEPVEVQSIDLHPEMAKKLRTLRRLNPGRSDAELLAQIEKEKNMPAPAGKQKKSWFSFS